MRSQFPFPIMSFIQFYSRLPKSCCWNPNRNQTQMNQMYLGDWRAGNAHLLQTTNCLNSKEKECAAHIQSLLQADVKQGRGAVSVMKRVLVAVRKTWETEPHWTRLNPTELRGTCFLQTSARFCTSWKHTSPPPTLKSGPQGIFLSQFLCPGLFPSCAVTVGSQQGTTADTDGSPGLWWLPYVA